MSYFIYKLKNKLFYSSVKIQFYYLKSALNNKKLSVFKY